MKERTWLALIALVVVVATAAKLHAAAEWALLADEAYYWVWSSKLAWGYFDQPPGIAGWIALERAAWGDSELAIRAGGILAGALTPLALLRHAGDRSLWLLWGVAAPPLAWLTLFATPDALLLAAWSLGLAAALSGRWRLAGVFGGLATLCKLSGGLLVPLLPMAEGRRGWARSRWAIPGAVLVPVPYVLWNLQHEWVSVRFPLHEGLMHPDAPGLLGPLLQVLGQLAVMTPPLAIVGGVWLVSSARPVLKAEAPRPVRLAWWTSAPVLVGFCVAAIGGPPEAHWPAPAWIGIGLGLSHASRRVLDSAWVTAWLALFASALVLIHGHGPIAPLPRDPAVRLTEGPVVAELVGRWALPAGVGPREPGVAAATPVLTERYQEAAFIHYYLGIPAVKAPGCGRDDQYDVWGGTLPATAVFVKPATSGEDLCIDTRYRKGQRHRRHGEDRPGRIVGVWDLWELRHAP
jgi:hypothetical protein